MIFIHCTDIYFHNEYIYKLITNSRQRNKTKNTIVKRRDRHTRTLLSVALPSRMTPLLTVIVCTSIVFVYITLYQDYAVRGCTPSRGTSFLHHTYIYCEYILIFVDLHICIYIVVIIRSSTPLCIITAMYIHIYTSTKIKMYSQ